MTTPRPALSVVVPTKQPWPTAKAVLEVLVAQAEPHDAEIVLVDGHGSAREPAARMGVRYVAAPGCDGLVLRAKAAVAARGRIVAFTEDHGIPTADYCEAVLRAHREDPRSAVAGAIVNGSTARAHDRANFLVAHANNVPPRDGIPPRWIPTTSNISYKRAVLPEQEPPPGWLEIVLNPTLLLSGEVHLDDRVRVTHIQSYGLVGLLRNQLHSARTISGLGRGFMGERPARSMIRAFLGLGPALVGPVVRLRRRGLITRRDFWQVMPFVLTLTVAGLLGFAWGALTGPGRSADRVR